MFRIAEDPRARYAKGVRVDFHCHSTASDGSLSPSDVAAAAHAAGVEWFALTDHDTLAGVDAMAAALAPSIRCVVACEVTVRYYQHTLHVLTYVPDACARQALEERLVAVREARAERLIKIAARLAKLGKVIDINPLLEHAKTRPLGRPDLARALVAAGHCNSEKQAFTRFLRDKGPADVPAQTWVLEDLLRLANAYGLRLALAHPHTLGSFELVRELYQNHAAAGLRGIEAYYGLYGAAQRQVWVDLAQALDLVVIGGSDFHGALRPDIPKPGIEMPPAVAERALSWLS